MGSILFDACSVDSTFLVVINNIVLQQTNKRNRKNHKKNVRVVRLCGDTPRPKNKVQSIRHDHLDTHRCILFV